MEFLLGTHHPDWLKRLTVPLFVSARRLRRCKALPVATCPWALDSGGFSELSMFGTWQTGAEQYVREVRRWARMIGRMEWAAVQDWMVEPFIRAKTGRTVREHQTLTVNSYLRLMALDASIPWVPVLQGWEHDDYLAHVEMYRGSGIHLERLPLVGLGSVCRRQNTNMAENLIRELHGLGIRLHGFGFKLEGLQRSGHWLASADSMAWSYNARKNPPLPGHTHRNCANCIEYALAWRQKVLQRIARGAVRPVQLQLF